MHIRQALKKIYSRVSFIVLSLSLFVGFALVDYFLLTRTTSWESFLKDNNPLYVFLSINLSWMNNFLIAVTLTFLIYIIEERKKYYGAAVSNSMIGTLLSLISVGCAVCGGFLLPLVGVAASLTAFPLQGLEIKVFSIALLLYSVNEMSLRIGGIFRQRSQKGQKRLPYLVGIIALLLVYLIPRLPYGAKNLFGIAYQKQEVKTTAGTSDNLFDEINPEKGIEIDARYGDLGPKMLAMGVIDLEKLKTTYEKAGQPLTKEQLDILTKGLDKKVAINRENSYFLLNFFWAAGLANKSRILTEGDITKYGKNQIGNFASTGGWSLGKTEPMNYYATENLIPLTQDQERLVEKVSSNIYRPCCNNSTAFPDCNHGMALLAVLQLMASRGATENQMYEAAKYFNAYWFPGNYYDLALYFKNKEGKSFKGIPAQILLGKDYSSASGWQSIKQWLADKGLIKQPPKQGGGCGV